MINIKKNAQGSAFPLSRISDLSPLSDMRSHERNYNAKVIKKNKQTN
jgi:hypothetical protein